MTISKVLAHRIVLESEKRLADCLARCQSHGECGCERLANRAVSGRSYLGSMNFSVKPISGKYSWTTHDDYDKAVDEARRSQIARDERGAHTRRLYRVNVYAKPA